MSCEEIPGSLPPALFFERMIPYQNFFLRMDTLVTCESWICLRVVGVELTFTGYPPSVAETEVLPQRISSTFNSQQNNNNIESHFDFSSRSSSDSRSAVSFTYTLNVQSHLDGGGQRVGSTHCLYSSTDIGTAKSAGSMPVDRNATTRTADSAIAGLNRADALDTGVRQGTLNMLTTAREWLDRNSPRRKWDFMHGDFLSKAMRCS